MLGQTSSNTTKFQFGVQTSTPPWGAQTGSSSSSTGITTFGVSSAQTSRSFGGFVTTTQSTPIGNTGFAFGTSTSPAFGTCSIPAFGQAFGASNSPFAAQSTSPAFGTSTTPGFGQTIGASSSPFGVQSTGPTFFTSTSPPFGQGFGASNSPFAAQSTSPAFGTSTTGFGQTIGASSSPFGAQSTSPAFGQGFGASSSPFAAQSTSPAFGTSTTPAFGQTIGASSSPFGAQSASPAFGTSASPALGQTIGASSSPFGAQSTSPAFGTSAIPAFGQTFGASRSPFGTQSTTQSIGNTVSAGDQRHGSRVAAYKSKPWEEFEKKFKLQSITAMSQYESKSMEELRFEDYELGDKGGETTMKASTPCNTTPSFRFPQTSPSSFPSISQPSSNPFGTSNTSPFPFTSISQPSSNPPFSSISNPFNTSNIATPFSFPSSTSLQVTSPYPSAISTYTTPTPSIPPTQTSINTVAQSPFSTPGSNIVNPTQPQPSNTPILQQNDLVQHQHQQQQQQQQQQPVLVVPVTNPFGTPRAMPQVSNGGTVQYGISSVPVVVDRPAKASVGVSSLSAARNQIRRQSIGFPAGVCKSRRHDLYKNKNGSDHPRVPFFSDDADQVPKTPQIRL